MMIFPPYLSPSHLWVSSIASSYMALFSSGVGIGSKYMPHIMKKDTGTLLNLGAKKTRYAPVFI